MIIGFQMQPKPRPGVTKKEGSPQEITIRFQALPPPPSNMLSSWLGNEPSERSSSLLILDLENVKRRLCDLHRWKIVKSTLVEGQHSDAEIVDVIHILTALLPPGPHSKLIQSCRGTSIIDPSTKLGKTFTMVSAD